MSIRPLLILALAAGCSSSSTPQSSGADRAAPAAAAAAPAAAPAAGQAPAESSQPSAPAPPTSSAAPPAPAPEPSAPLEPKFKEITIPANTSLSVTLVTPVGSKTSKVEDQVTGKLAAPIVVSGTTVVPSGSEIIGSVIGAKESGRVKGKALVVFRFSQLTVRGERHRIQTAQVAREAASSTKSDVKKGAVGAGAGALIGGLAGGGGGAAIGATVGGAGTVLATKGKEVELPAGTRVSTRLTASVKVLVPFDEK